MRDAALALIVFGSLILLAGVILLFAGRLPWLGNLPGDIHARGKNWSFSFPVVTCLLASVILTLLINVLIRFFRK